MFVYDSQLETQAKAISYGYDSDDTKGPHRADADTHGLLMSSAFHVTPSCGVLGHGALAASAEWPVEDAITKVDRPPPPAAISKVSEPNEIVSDGSSC